MDQRFGTTTSDHPAPPPDLPLALGNASKVWELEVVRRAEDGAQIAELWFVRRTPRSWMGGLLFAVPLTAFGALFMWAGLFRDGGAPMAVIGATAASLGWLFPLGMRHFVRESCAEQRAKMPEGGLLARAVLGAEGGTRVWVWPGLQAGPLLREIVDARMRSGGVPFDGPGPLRATGRILAFRAMVLEGRDAQTGARLATMAGRSALGRGAACERACEAWARTAGLPIQTGEFGAARVE